jgi:AmmeMemoRadiSam system protein B/AmmeMemoRadiSam system protein A
MPRGIYLFSEKQNSRIIEKAHLSPAWYEQNPELLKKQIEKNIERGRTHFLGDFDIDNLKAIVVPHAGHHYSGLCAAVGYAALQQKKNLNRIILLAPSHHVHFEGIGLPAYQEYQTCLGSLFVDIEACELLKESTFCTEQPAAHEKEHALEIQFPFLHVVAPHVNIVPLLVGELTTHAIPNIKTVLKKIIDEQTIIIVSSDFIHYGPDYAYQPFNTSVHKNLVALDGAVLQALSSYSLLELQTMFNRTQATVCGRNPLAILTMLCEDQADEIKSSLCCYYVSAHADALSKTENNYFDIVTSALNDHQLRNSVSYATLLYTQKKDSFIQKPTAFEAKLLCNHARQSLEKYFDADKEYPPLQINMPFFNQTNGAFVTLQTKQGSLRGCIGNITSHRPVHETIQKMALAAAFEDQRFEPVTKEELDAIKIEISLLSKPQKIKTIDEFILGTHGLILTWIDPKKNITRSAVFLPEVAIENNWSKTEMLEQLSKKAGCAPEAWKESSFEIFYSLKIKEKKSARCKRALSIVYAIVF